MQRILAWRACAACLSITQRNDDPDSRNSGLLPGVFRAGAAMIQAVLRMGDPRLLRVSRPVEKFDTPELHALIRDMEDTMAHLNGAGLAAPQIGVDLRVVIFGVAANPRYPDAEEVPYTVLINPVIEPLGTDEEDGWEGCLSVPGMRGVVPRFTHLALQRFRPIRQPDRTRSRRLPRTRGAARMRPPRRHSLPDAGTRFSPVRFYRGVVSGRQRGRRRLNQRSRLWLTQISLSVSTPTARAFCSSRSRMSAGSRFPVAAEYPQIAAVRAHDHGPAVGRVEGDDVVAAVEGAEEGHLQRGRVGVSREDGAPDRFFPFALRSLS